MVDELLAPISDAFPCGSSLRINNQFDSPYYQLKTLRSEARAAERSRIQHGETKFIFVQDWQPIARLAEQLLREQTKDLEIASWLLEAWVRIEGIAGLIAGLNILSGLIEGFSAALFHDLPEEMELQLNAVHGLNGEHQPGTIIMPLLCLPIVKNSAGDVAAWEYQKAFEFEKQHDPLLRKKMQDEGVRELEFLRALIQISDQEFGAQQVMELKEGYIALDNCEKLLAEHFVEHAFEFTQIRQSLDQLMLAIQGLYDLDRVSKIEPKSTEFTESRAQLNHKGSQQDRQSALQMLNEVAEYFLTHEIHSPIGYLLKRALRWAEMGLPELIQEILMDANSKFEYGRITGIEGLEPFSAMSEQYEHLMTNNIQNLGGEHHE